ncbi:LysR family transcriptional regulator [Burkholderia sp. Ax-1719]|jgi:DNA-binding transcriptional LysR family regulator|uniref:LysR family transcriptional regulator n=1 Tax=Burkholderia sp. Ax-1719 TaxID=2608334 RepID=UPI00141DAB85|nr:LysR family transcriptional regulator [Burkholderia sp. Ax-1719]NIE62436.1 LysR family transcriptional regulator [Burkholderia sp. Ax-1719]
MIRELTTLLAVAREGTFAAAGKRIGLTQAAVSAQMQRLEAELGFALFEREGRHARLNVRGRQVLGQAQEVLRLYGKLSTVSVDPAAEVRVNIGAIASVQRAQLPGALAAFHRQCPGAHTRVIPGLSMELVNLVDAGELDFAAIIRPPFALQSDLRWSPIASEPFRLIVPRALKGNDWMALLAQQAFIRYDRASFGGRQVDRFLKRMQIVVQEVCELDELEAIVKLVGNGVGVALVPQTATWRRWPADVRAIDLGHHTFHRDIGVVHRDAVQMSEAARVLLGLLAGQGAVG